MLSADRVIRLQFDVAELDLAQHFARNATLGGVSRVRGADRQTNLVTDQQVGQLGELGLSLYLAGTPLFYQLTRTVRDLAPEQGDDGADLLATNIDVKASLMRASSDPLKYRLLVRPRERHPDTVYVLALVPPTVDECWLVGWTTEADLPSAPARDGPFEGAFVVPATHLYPLPPLRFNWTWNFRELTGSKPNTSTR